MRKAMHINLCGPLRISFLMPVINRFWMLLSRTLRMHSITAWLLMEHWCITHRVNLLCLRYMHKVEDSVWAIKECLLLFKDCEKKIEKDIANLLWIILQRNGINFQDCRVQGYDNGSNMSGIYKHQSCKNPQAMFRPCSIHSLNFCDVHAVQL